jgi:Na+:H+ antiporter, NhaA family
MHSGPDTLRVPSGTPIFRIVRPFQDFAANKVAGGLVLLLCTIVALAWANSPWGETYTHFWHTPLTVTLAGYTLGADLHFWVNDALMVLFFFVVGLEIKREMLVGELAAPRNAALPIMAALGGVIVPATLYLSFNAGGPGGPGWGVPMATDIAFAIGVMSLLGDRVPFGLQVFLTALAIVDDIAAVLVIAVFYTSQLNLMALGMAGLVLLILMAANRLGVRHPGPYALLGLLLWLCVVASGVHATISGVLLAFTIPARTILNPREFLQHGRFVLSYFEGVSGTPGSDASEIDQQSAIEALEDACEKAQPPLLRLERGLHPWTTWVVMPIFALANAGVAISGDLMAILVQPVTLGVIIGLGIGKPVGITLASWLAVRSHVASLPSGVRWSHIHAAGWLGGIGFTMSLFVASLAFSDALLLSEAKIGILAGSLTAGIIGSLLLIRIGKGSKVSS